MSEYVIYPMHVGSVVRQKSNLAYMRDPGKTIEIPLISWYLTDGQHHILVDTGGDPPTPEHRKQPYTRTKEQEPEEALKRLGVDPKKITDVFLTHLHWDHSCNNHLFPNASFYVQKVELQYAAAPLIIHRGSYDQKVIFKTQYTILNGDCSNVLDGISVYFVPGHTPGSQAVAVDTKGGKYLLSGDLIGLYECYESNPMICSGGHLDLSVYYDSLNKVKNLGYHVLPSHDPLIFRHSCYPPLD